MQISEILTHEKSFRYQLLDRMRCDCEFYLGHGNRRTEYLWSGNEADHIDDMKAIWNSLPADEKPQWLTYEQIEKYEKEFKESAFHYRALIMAIEGGDIYNGISTQGTFADLEELKAYIIKRGIDKGNSLRIEREHKHGWAYIQVFKIAA